MAVNNETVMAVCPILSVSVVKSKCLTISCQWITTTGGCCYGLINPETPEIDIIRYKGVTSKEIKTAKSSIRLAIIANKYIEYCTERTALSSTDVLNRDIEDLVLDSVILNQVVNLSDKLIRTLVNEQVFKDYVNFQGINSVELSSILFLKPEVIEEIRLTLY